MSRTLLHPPATTTGFRFLHGCGEPHEYDGIHGIDCAPCIEVVHLMSPEERIAHPNLRGPLVAAGETPGEIDAMRRVEEAKRHAASWRLVETEDEVEPGDEDPEAEEARLRARLAELEQAKAASEPKEPKTTQRRAPTKA